MSHVFAPGDRIGSYEVESLIGRGGMGEVYRARDTRLKRDVALKVLPHSVAADADRLARFEREAQTLAALNHQHIAAIYGIEESNGARALVMELVDGQTLADRIAHGPLPVDEALPVARQIAEALEAAHGVGIIHRDLKPANIALRPDGTVKVLDFGLAKAMDSVAPSSVAANSPTLTSAEQGRGAMMTHAGVILGTAAYMAPEQARGKSVDARADIWAFGCVLYEMLTGTQAFAGETVSDSIAAILGREPAFAALPAQVPPSVRRLLRRCLVKDPRERLHHLADARLELLDAGVAEHVATQPTIVRKSSAAIATIVGVIAALASAGATLVWQATTRADVPTPLIQLALPATGVNIAANGVLISPDGRALVALGPADASVLHLLDGSASRLLDSPALCWSPDSRSLMLQGSGGRLLRMNIAGGPAIDFGRFPGVWGRGCAWSRDGTVLVDNERSLFRLDPAGGNSTPVEVNDDGGTDALRVHPVFLPDGRHFLYWLLAANGTRTVRAGSLDSAETRLIGPSDAPVVYAAGMLLFQRGTTLVAQRFDHRTLALAGEPRAITRDAAPGTITVYALYSASDTGMLAYAATNGGVAGELVWVDRHGNVLGAPIKSGGSEFLNPALSPDGTRVVANRIDPATGNWDIWMSDLASGIATRLTTQPGDDFDGVWSPDGREIAFVSRRPPRSGIYRMAIAGGREELLFESKTGFDTRGVGLRVTDWTRDGRFLVFDADDNIMALPLTPGGTPIAVVNTDLPEQGGRVSTDSRWIAYQAFDSEDDAVYVQPFPAGGQRTRVSVKTARHPQWRADGRELFWTGLLDNALQTRTLYSAEVSVDGNTLRTLAPRLVVPPNIAIASLVDNRHHVAVAPDGQRFLLRRATGFPGAAIKVIQNWAQLLPPP